MRHSWETDHGDEAEFLQIAGESLDRFRPDVLLTYGGDRVTRTVLAGARRRGIATVFALHNFSDRDRAGFADVDAVIVPSEFSAAYYRRTLGLECAVLPNVVDPDRVRVEWPVPTYLTFVNPSPEKGVYPFARIADELGRRRPDIPILVVESRGTEATLVGCGLDLRVHGNVSLMARTPDPRDFLSVTRVLLMPSLFLESQGLAAVEAMTNGIPVIASDRGALPETLGRAGIVLPLPEHLTPESRHLPTAEEVAPWVDWVIRLWDDPALYDRHRHLALAEAPRWSPEVLGPLHVRFFSEFRRSSPEGGPLSLDRSRENRPDTVARGPSVS